MEYILSNPNIKTDKNKSNKKFHSEKYYKNGKLCNNNTEFQKKRSDKEQEEIGKRIFHLIKNKVNFISGTVAPAPSSKKENYLNIEDLKIGFEILLKQYDSNCVISAQPKYMGSRCNVYLFANKPDLCYSVSRNGFLITKERVNMESIYHKLLDKLGLWMNQNNIKMVILDGELLPWSALGKYLIENDFIPVKAGLEVEIECSKKFGFDYNYNQMKENLNNLIHEKELKIQNKKILSNNFQLHHHQLQIFNAYLESKLYLQPTEQMENLLNIYSRQMDLYGTEGELDYKPFSILKIIYNDEFESIPLLDHSITQSQMYEMLYSGIQAESQLILNINENNIESEYSKLKEWFEKKTIHEGYEGIMLKPDIIKIDKLPLLKVRNQEYLSIIYGYDYKLEHNYSELVKKKTTSRKIYQSIKEFKLGLNLLTMKYTNLDSDEYKSRLENFINCELDGNNLDPRL